MQAFHIETLRLHAGNAYGVPSEKVTPQQFGATVYAFGCKYDGISVTASAASLPVEDDRTKQSDCWKSEHAERPTAKRPPEECISRPLGSSDHLLAKIAVSRPEANDPRSTSELSNGDRGKEMQPDGEVLGYSRPPANSREAELPQSFGWLGEARLREQTAGFSEQEIHAGEKVRKSSLNKDAPGDEEALLATVSLCMEHSRGLAPDEESYKRLRAETRQAVVMPILGQKRWTRCRWATKAGVGKNGVYEYLAGRRTLTDENRRAMAEALGLEPTDLPE